MSLLSLLNFRINFTCFEFCLFLDMVLVRFGLFYDFLAVARGFSCVVLSQSCLKRLICYRFWSWKSVWTLNGFPAKKVSIVLFFDRNCIFFLYFSSVILFINEMIVFEKFMESKSGVLGWERRSCINSFFGMALD